MNLRETHSTGRGFILEIEHLFIILFYLLINNKRIVLLFNLEANGIGYFIGKMFVRGLAYDDYIVLIAASTSRAMRRMLFTCDSFADDFSIVCNAKKSKCLIFEPTRKATSFINPKTVFFTSEVMQLRMLTNGIIIDHRSDDGADISMIGQINNVCVTLVRLVLCLK